MGSQSPPRTSLIAWWSLSAVLSSLTGLIFWALAQLPLMVWLAILPVNLARLAIALYLSPVAPLAAIALPASACLLLARLKAPAWLVPLPPLLLFGAALTYGRMDTQGTTPAVFAAAKRGDVIQTREQLLVHMVRFQLKNEAIALIKVGTDVNVTDSLGNSVLVWSRDPEMAAIILQAGATPTASTLRRAAFWGDRALIQQLLAATADNGRSLVAEGGGTALLELAGTGTGATPEERAAIAQLLVDRGVNPNVTDSHGSTPLMEAAEMGYPPVISVLLQAGANPNQQDGNGRTALHHAAARPMVDGRSADTLEALLNANPQVNGQDKRGHTPLMMVVDAWQQMESEASQAEPRDQKRYQSLRLEYGRVVRSLLQAGAEVTLKDAQGQTALDRAASNPELLKLLQQAK